MNIRLSFFLVLIILSGCGVFGHKYSMEHVSYKELISEDFNEDLWIPIEVSKINPFARGKAEAPREAFLAYCKRDGGTLRQVEVDRDLSRGRKEVKELTGTFQCRDDNSGAIVWMVEIDARPHVGGLQVSGGYLFRVKDLDVTSYNREVVKQKMANSQAELATMLKRERFLTKASAPKSKGERVCTWRNVYGYVEDVANDKLKVLIKGAVRTSIPGFFFTERAAKFYAEAKNEYLWDDSKNWAVCDFSS